MALDETPKKLVPAQERKEMFHERYGNELDPALSLAALVTAAGRMLAEILPLDDANAGMTRMLKPLFDTSGVLPGDEYDLPDQWAEALEGSNSNCFSEWPLGAVLHDLTAYTLYGIVLHDGTAEEIEAHLRGQIEHAERFYAMAPTAIWKEAGDLDNFMTRLRGRWALDRMEPISPEALAWFSNLSVGRMRNLMSGKTRTFNPLAVEVETSDRRVEKEQRIPAHEALAWLEDRDSYYPSIWREQELSLDYVSHPIGTLETVCFVPVARDGSVFSPGLQRNGSFTVGRKGAEKHVIAFEEALHALQRMETPYWRRPNALDNWGIVRGVRWVRLSGIELNRFAAHPDLKLLEPGSEA